MHAVILAIGDELVLGQTVDTNSAYLSAQLARRGIGTLYHQTVADDRAAIAAAIRQASQAAGLVIISGGLGPTDDDLTRQALADAMGSELVLDEPSLAAIAAFFAQRRRPMAQRNRTQAMHPADSLMIPNGCGTAPGIKAQLNRAVVYVIPGVPREMLAMFLAAIAPDLDRSPVDAANDRGVILATKINTFGAGESNVAELLGDLMHRERNPKVGTTVAAGVVSVRVRSEFPDLAQAHAELSATADEVERRLGPIVFGRDERTLQEAVVSLLQSRHCTLATAESCTGGLVGAMVTDVPGASAVYLGGWVTYANRMKAEELAVPVAMIEEHGAVSEPVARAMARGALQRSGADLAVGVTGVAGPEGGTPDKPVGDVWIALACKRAGSAADIETEALLYHLPGDRQAVRDRAAKCALQMLRFHLMGVPLDRILWGASAQRTS